MLCIGFSVVSGGSGARSDASERGRRVQPAPRSSGCVYGSTLCSHELSWTAAARLLQELRCLGGDGVQETSTSSQKAFSTGATKYAVAYLKEYGKTLVSDDQGSSGEREGGGDDSSGGRRISGARSRGRPRGRRKAQRWQPKPTEIDMESDPELLESMLRPAEQGGVKIILGPKLDRRQVVDMREVFQDNPDGYWDEEIAAQVLSLAHTVLRLTPKQATALVARMEEYSSLHSIFLRPVALKHRMQELLQLQRDCPGLKMAQCIHKHPLLCTMTYKRLKENLEVLKQDLFQGDVGEACWMLQAAPQLLARRPSSLLQNLRILVAVVGEDAARVAIKKRPQLLALEAAKLERRIQQLPFLLPGIDASRIVQLKPQVLLYRDLASRVDQLCENMALSRVQLAALATKHQGILSQSPETVLHKYWKLRRLVAQVRPLDVEGCPSGWVQGKLAADGLPDCGPAEARPASLEVPERESGSGSGTGPHAFRSEP